ncbi:TadE/TadG family type IV pilus assembly protein [Acidisoma silvae]|uniref:Pilus assembly protein n=1 Tax=Acidisoma silvae TaxID=2802396 RepID=A0A963YRR0_9PROT|nr:TadE family protein [Acidisoma silvae]MCB8875908.1 pilus assembly protein [Acidisoma silvae]
MIGIKRSKAGVAAVEFAMAWPLAFVIFAGTFSIGTICWIQSGLQVVAFGTARCLAIGETACPAGNGPAYAVSLANTRLYKNVITASNVAVTSATTCNGASGSYSQVTITDSSWIANVLPSKLSKLALVVKACYPTMNSS